MLTRTHPIARRLRALRADPALRAAEGVFVAEGVHLAREALHAAAPIEAAVVSSRLSASAEGRDLLRALIAAGVEVHDCAQTILDGLQDARSPQPVVIVVGRTPPALSEVGAGRGGPPLLVVACGVQEPGNLGALLRTADAGGASGFVATPGSASLTHPRAVRASMGAIFRLPAIEADIESTFEEIESRGLRVIGADAQNAVAYDEVDWTVPLALLFGGEGAGLPREAERRLDLRAGVPMAPGVESLSVNAAAAVLLFEAARKRRAVTLAG